MNLFRRLFPTAPTPRIAAPPSPPAPTYPAGAITFTDAGGRKYGFLFNCYHLKRANEILGINLSTCTRPAPNDGPRQIAIILTNVEVTANLLYVILEEQVKAYGLTDEDFGRSLAGPVLFNATEAFMLALAMFHQQAGHESTATELRAYLDHFRKIMTGLSDAIQAGLNAAVQHTDTLN